MSLIRPRELAEADDWFATPQSPMTADEIRAVLNVGMWDWFKTVGVIVIGLGSVAIAVVAGIAGWMVLEWAVREVWPIGVAAIAACHFWGGS